MGPCLSGSIHVLGSFSLLYNSKFGILHLEPANGRQLPLATVERGSFHTSVCAGAQEETRDPLLKICLWTLSLETYLITLFSRICVDVSGVKKDIWMHVDHSRTVHSLINPTGFNQRR